MALATVIKNFGKVEIAINNLTEEKTMADDSMAFVQMIRQQGGEDFLRSLVEGVLAKLMDYEVSSQIGAGLHERSGERGAYRKYEASMKNTGWGSTRWRSSSMARSF